MIKASLRYLQQEAIPRWRDIIFAADFIAALVVGVVIGLWGQKVLPDTTKVSDFGFALLTYTAIALGFCLAGLTLVLTLPHESLVKLLISIVNKKTQLDSYSDLLFVFSWTAVLHWVVLVVSIIITVIWGTQQPILIDSSSMKHRLFVGIVSGLSAYCLFQFLITLITLSQVGRIYINSVKHSK